MVFVSVTRLRVKSVWYLLPFLWNNFKVTRQVVRSPGFFGGKLLVDRGRTFWTVTVWSSQESMRGFRNSGVHRQVMPKLAGWCNEASTAHWEQSQPETPEWLEIHRRMSQEGRTYPVNECSPEFNLHSIPAPRVPTRLIQTLKPAANS